MVANRAKPYWLAMVGTQVVLSFAVISLCDRSARHFISNLQQYHLQRQAATDVNEVGQTISALKGEISMLESQIATQQRRRLPTADEFRTLAARYKIAPRRFERLGSSSKIQTGDAKFMIALTGRPLDLIPFLHDLWANYQLPYDQVILQRTDDIGENVTLTIACQLATT